MNSKFVKITYLFLCFILCVVLISAISCNDGNETGESLSETSQDNSSDSTQEYEEEINIDELDYTIDGISYTIEHFDNPKKGFGYSSYDSPLYHLGADNGYLLKNGYVVLIEVNLWFNGHGFCRYYIYSTDGKRTSCPEYNPDFGLYLVLETDDGNYIVNDGQTIIYDSEWNPIETLDVSFTYAHPLDNGRYFAVNDVWTMNYYSEFWNPGGIWDFLPERFALYRYTEKLTESEFAEIRAVDGGFECVYPEDSEKSGESLFYPVDDMVPFDEQYFTLVYDEESEQYYYLDVAGNKLFDMNFDFACEPTNNSAVVRVDKDYYVIQAIAQD